jgi:hypothetical protein
MPNVRTLQRSFAGGEVTPEFYGRIDDIKYQTGLAMCRNFIVLPHGPVANRAGTSYVRPVKDSTKRTRLIPFTFSSTQTFAIELGAGYFRFHTQGGTVLSAGSPYEVSNPYAEEDLFDIHYVQSADVLTLVHPNYAPRELRRLGATSWVLSTISFAATIAAPTGVGATSAGFTVAKYTYSYCVTAIDADGVGESVSSTGANVSSNLLETGCTNTITWTAVTGASRYNVYKYSGGLYGYIGQTDTTTLVDDNITADISKTPPIYENLFASAGDYPGAVSYFEQRRCFAGTNNKPQNLWMTKSGTESSMSYSLPVRDDDRIAFRVAAREANVIRHMVPLGSLVLLTSAAEWRVTSVNSDAITPSSVSVRPQSYIGANNAQPVIVNNNLIYVAARGGHVRELGYNDAAGGYITSDLSLRAPHLFDQHTIGDIAFAKSPYPIAWFVRDDGKLIGLTYVPDQQVGAWHQHDTDGEFESVCVVAEGDDDVAYVVVKRNINGSDVRYVERMGSRWFDSQDEAFFVDCGLAYDGTNTSSLTVTVTGGTTWGSSEELTLTASSSLFTYPGTSDVGDAIVLLAEDGTQCRLTIESTSSTTVATARTDKVIPAGFRATATTSWAFARNAINAINHLEGKTVNILADGAVHPQRVVTSGTITLDVPAIKVKVGLPIEADLQTLPLAFQVEAFGQGRTKNVNTVFLRVYESSGVFVGPDEDNLTEYKQRSNEVYGAPPSLKSQELRLLITPTWSDSGQVFVRQSDPLPITVMSMAFEVAVGG